MIQQVFIKHLLCARYVLLGNENRAVKNKQRPGHYHQKEKRWPWDSGLQRTVWLFVATVSWNKEVRSICDNEDSQESRTATRGNRELKMRGYFVGIIFLIFSYMRNLNMLIRKKMCHGEEVESTRKKGVWWALREKQEIA